MALGEDDRAMADLNQAAKLNKSKDLFTLVRCILIQQFVWPADLLSLSLCLRARAGVRVCARLRVFRFLLIFFLFFGMLALLLVSVMLAVDLGFWCFHQSHMCSSFRSS